MHSNNSSLHTGYRRGRERLEDASDAMSSSFAAVRERAEPVIDHAAERMAEQAHRLRLQAQAASERSLYYMRERPVASALVVGAAGALVFMALRALMMRRY